MKQWIIYVARPAEGLLANTIAAPNVRILPSRMREAWRVVLEDLREGDRAWFYSQASTSMTHLCKVEQCVSTNIPHPADPRGSPHAVVWKVSVLQNLGRFAINSQRLSQLLSPHWTSGPFNRHGFREGSYCHLLPDAALECLMNAYREGGVTIPP